MIRDTYERQDLYAFATMTIVAAALLGRMGAADMLICGILGVVIGMLAHDILRGE